jgi:DNA polymerase (family 10)
MKNFEVANELRELGILLNLSGSDPYKARAYVKGAEAIESLSESVEALARERHLTEIPGIGNSLAGKILELLRTGKISVLERLRKEYPPGVIELSQVPGLSLKRIQLLHSALGINDIESLEQACLSHRVCAVKGMGEKTEASILEGIRRYQLNQRKILLLHAREIAERLVGYLKSAALLRRIEVVGAVRRWHEVVDEVKIVAETDDNEILWDVFLAYPLIVDVLEESENVCRVRLSEGIIVELFAARNFAAKVLFETGSQKHIDELAKQAAKCGFTFDSNGLQCSQAQIYSETEEEIYRSIHLHYIPPELREGEGEIEEASRSDFDDLIDIPHIQGMTHCHTTFSDGSASVELMARAAERMGMKYLTVTDHSPAAHYAGGLSTDELKAQWDEIDHVQEKVKIKLLKGTESDILADGHLDYPDEILDQFDLIIASVHNRFSLDFEQMTERIVRCMRDKHFKVWGHPLGRLLLRRPPIKCDVEKILDAIAESRAAIEINGDPYRLDLEPKWIKAARVRNIRFIISTDAHAIHDYRNLEYGVHEARRAGVRKQEVLNTYSLGDFRRAVKKGA